ncbi:hypothetical protein ELI_08320 [Erythrobacter litoralis HTCC2594]|uniref:Uncharacterized protein n=1 Tax=Erythrobacter litoralis (strain HTCC2594) TaxID=314225 RepID=Q2N985_ERYLH|nr:hypothetical protein ELI_08320 [Erythrobacter litoralis HTCC2594]
MMVAGVTVAESLAQVRIGRVGDTLGRVASVPIASAGNKTGAAASFP